MKTLGTRGTRPKWYGIGGSGGYRRSLRFPLNEGALPFVRYNISGGDRMFFTLLLVTFGIAIAVSFTVVKLFGIPISAIFKRIIEDKIHTAWVRYINFAACVVGVAGGVRIYNLERYINEGYNNQDILVLTLNRWILEVYRTVIETLKAIAWMYLVVFVFALIAYVIVRGLEMRQARKIDLE